MSFGGGSGSGSIASSTDVVLNSPSNNQILGYNASLAKWQNQTAIGGINDAIAIVAEDARFATPQAALNAAPSGATVIFTASHTLTGGAVYTISRPMTIHLAPGVVLNQTVYAKPVFDVFATNSVTIIGRGALLQGSAARPAFNVSSFRQDALSMYWAGVWCNGSQCYFDVQTDGFTCGIYLSNCNWTNTGRAQQSDNRVVLISDNADFGLNYIGQDDLVIESVVARNTQIHPTNAAPPHAVYGSGNHTLRSHRVTVGSLMSSGNLYSNAFQFKYTDGLTIASMQADQCVGLCNFIDVSGVKIGTGILTSATGSVDKLVDFQAGAGEMNTNITIESLTLAQQVTTLAASKPALGLVASNVHIGSLMVSDNINDTAGVSEQVSLSGSNIVVDSLQANSVGFASVALLIGTSVISDAITVRNIKMTKAYAVAQIQSTSTNVILDYNPADILGYLGSAASDYAVRTINGVAVGYTAARAPFERLYSLGGGSVGSAVCAEPFMETRTHYKITNNTAFQVPAPGTDGNAFVGMVHEVSIENGTAGSLGTITWAAIWTLNGAFASPTAGMVGRLSFRWNGTNWVHVG